MKFLNLINLVVSDQVPERTVFLVPRVEFVRHIFPDGTFEERFQFDPKQCGMITNIGKEK